MLLMIMISYIFISNLLQYSDIELNPDYTNMQFVAYN